MSAWYVVNDTDGKAAGPFGSYDVATEYAAYDDRFTVVPAAQLDVEIPARLRAAGRKTL